MLVGARQHVRPQKEETLPASLAVPGRVNGKPLAILWQCPLGVEEYVAAGPDVDIPRPNCPACEAMTFW